MTIADLNEELGKTYAVDLTSRGLKCVGLSCLTSSLRFADLCRVNFTHTDVASWGSQIKAFKSAIDFSPSHSTIDVVVAAAGLKGAPFLLPNEEPASLDKDPPLPSVDPININLIGLSYTAKLAQHYFGLPTSTSQTPKSLILICSTGGYMEVPLLAVYNASKWGVRGLFRTIREPLAAKSVRTNLIAPWIMDTPMSQMEVGIFRAVDLPIGNTEHVVQAIIHCAVDNSIVGRAFAVGPNKIIDLQDDEEGQDAGPTMQGWWRSEVPGHKGKMAQFMKMSGF